MLAMTTRFLSAALAALLIIGTIQLSAQNFDAAEQQAKADLAQSLQDLNATRTTIAKEKIPLIREVSKLEDEVRQKR